MTREELLKLAEDEGVKFDNRVKPYIGPTDEEKAQKLMLSQTD